MRKLTILVAVVLAATLAWGGAAFAHGAGFEGDDNNNRVLTWCASGKLPSYIETDFAQGAGATDGWNQGRALYGEQYPIYKKTTTQTYPTCEVRLVPSAGVPEGDALYTWVAGGRDSIQFDTPALANRTNKWKQYVATHEAGHGLGLTHEQGQACGASVMRVDCTQSSVVGFPTTFDLEHVRSLWVGSGAIYPNGTTSFGTDEVDGDTGEVVGSAVLAAPDE